MGLEASKDKLKTPWRKDIKSWKEKEVKELLKIVTGVTPTTFTDKNMPYFNILMIGEAKAGKSSSINTLYGTVLQRVTKIALSGASAEGITRKFKVHDLKKTGDQKLIVRICDTMGFCQPVDSGWMETYENILDGKVLSGFKYSAEDSQKSVNFKENPELSDQIHCVVLVIDANNAQKTEMSDLIRECKFKANDKDISLFVLLTKIDEVSELVKHDTEYVYYSKGIQQCVTEVAELTGMEKNDVFPIRNIVQETEMSRAVKEQVLALTALKEMIYRCETTIRRKDN